MKRSQFFLSCAGLLVAGCSKLGFSRKLPQEYRIIFSETDPDAWCTDPDAWYLVTNKKQGVINLYGDGSSNEGGKLITSADGPIYGSINY